MNYKQITQDQLELWLNDSVTKAYLQSLWWSRDQVKEVMGKGVLINRDSMEKTFAQTLEAEGQKLGYSNAMNVLNELLKHNLVEIPEGGLTLEIPDIENILED